ncbi:MAG: PAS domain S-box protein [Deltaproteobacteria bacterium]|nr:PAS domain S-box protein [Deltaproteobacteria bacterium]
MDMQDTGKRHEPFQATAKIPIWLTTAAVIVLILLLALTVNQTREQGIVEQFSRQQLTIARGTATGIEDFISGVEKSLILISRLPYVRGTTPEATGQGIQVIYKDLGKMEFIEMPYVRGGADEAAMQSIKVVYEDLGGKVDFIALEDADGVVIIGYPPSVLDGMLGKSFEPHPHFSEIQKTGKPYIGTPLPPTGEGDAETHDKSRSVIFAVPTYDSENRFSGAVLAALSLSNIVDRYITSKCETCCAWVMDSEGIMIVHPDPSCIGHSIAVLEHPASRGASLKEALRKGEEGYGEYRLPREGEDPEKYILAYAPIDLGERHWLVTVAAPYNEIILLARKGFLNIMFGASGLIVVVIIASASIATSSTKRLRLKEELKRLREREEWQGKLLTEHRKTEGVIEGSPIPTFVLDKEHRVILWNRACSELTAFDAADMIGTDQHPVPFYNSKRPMIADIIIDADMDALKKFYDGKNVRESSTVKGAYEATDFFSDLGGKARHLYFLAAPIYDEQGEIIAAIETIQDVTQQIEMDIRLKEYAETLQNELNENIKLREEVEGLYNYLQSIIDSLPDKIFDLSRDGIINYVSRDVKKDGGIISQKFGGKHFADFVDEENRQFVLDIWEYAKQGIFNPYEMTVTARDGSRRNLMITPRPVKGTDRLILVQRDITQFKALEKKFYESQQLAALGQLSAGIAHEVRNPLSSIKMSLQILEKRLRPEGNDLKRFQIAQREVEHLEKLVNDILIYAKPSDPVKQPSNIKKIVDHALAMAEKSVADKNIRVEKRFAQDLSPLDADPAMLEQAFLNIYHNAIDAMEEGGTLSISAVQADGRVRIEIRDDGCGISEEDMPHIFNPFFTKKSYGTGLGLAQIKKIVDLHQGTIEISSEEGRGTDVVVTFPAPAQEKGTRPAT